MVPDINNNQISVLYNIEPIGLETGLVESLSGYIIRLAFEHNISVGNLFNKLIFPEMNKEYLINSSDFGGNRFFEGAKTINGYKENSIEIVRVLQKLTTRNDLSNLTLFKLKDILPLRNLLKENLAWCPECIKCWKNNKETVYYPLIWYIKAVKICKIHQRYLKEFCSKCNKKIDILRRQMILGYCPHCYYPLEQEDEKVTNSLDEMSWHSFVYCNVEELLLEKQEHLTNKNFKEEFYKHLNLVNEKCFFGKVSRFSQFLDVPKTTLVYWLNGKNTPSINNILKICFKLDRNITSFLKAPKKSGDNIFQIHDNNLISAKPQDIRKRRQLNHEFIEKKLHELLSKNPPVSMNLAAKEIGHDRRVLYRNFPELCKQISSRYRVYLKQRSDSRIKRLKAEIRKVTDLLIDEGVFPSRRKVEARLNMNGILKEKILQEYWKSLKVKRGLSEE